MIYLQKNTAARLFYIKYREVGETVINYKISFSCANHIGLIRTKNQDNLICNGQFLEIDRGNAAYSANGYVFSEATSVFGAFDGMGGEECGEAASYIAAKAAADFSFENELRADLLQFCVKANDEICTYASNNSISSMGTTAAMLAFAKSQIVLCNIGDSKIFRFSDNELEQISVDHVGISVFGKKPPLMQSLGISPTEMIIEPYVSCFEYNPGDIYLISSDGLTDMVAVDEIRRILSDIPFENAAQTLLDKSLESGGRDNITIMLFKIGRRKKSVFDLFLKK